MECKPLSYTLPKSERLHLKRSIDSLFAEGKSFVAYPLRVVYRMLEEVQPARSQMLVSVSKKYFKRANKRNRIKRLVREAYRLNKHPWLERLEEQGYYAHIAWMNVAKEEPSYREVEKAVQKAFWRIARQEAWVEVSEDKEVKPLER